MKRRSALARAADVTFFRVAFYLLLAFAFLGVRLLWDPDEGRYTNVALNMLESGDWVHPARSEEAGHWTKPPLTYWAIAGSVRVFGYSPWAARVPVALAFLACVLLVGRMARRLAPGRERLAALVFATMALPLCAATLVTTDFLLAAALALACWGYVEARFGAQQRARPWVVLMWIGFGLGFLTKGPPALLPLLAIAAFEACGGRARRIVWWVPEGLLAFVLLAFGWFAWVAAHEPRLLSYFLGHEVAQRIAGDGFGRNAQWYGWLTVYGPTFLLGSLPWTGRLLRALRAAPALWPRWRAVRTSGLAGAEERDVEVQVFVLLWLLLPLLALCLAQSRLPLYALPLFVPIALLVAQAGPPQPLPTRWLAAWVVVLLALRAGVAWWPTHKDASAWADAIRTRVPTPVHEVVFVDDMARYALHLYLHAEVEKLSLDAPASDAIDREFDHGFVAELFEDEPGLVFVTPQARFAPLATAAAEVGRCLVPQGAPFQARILFVAVRCDAGAQVAHH